MVPGSSCLVGDKAAKSLGAATDPPLPMATARRVGADSAGGSGSHPPVTVNVNVLGNGGGGEARDAERGMRSANAGESRAEAQGRREDGKALAAIRKKTDLIPRLVKKVDATPERTAALVKGSERRRLRTAGTVVEKDFSASAHFTNIRWRGRQYVIRRAAALIVEALYIALKTYGLPGLTQKEVFAQVYGADKKKWPSASVRIQNFFRKGDAKRLWDAGCIGHDGKGSFHLNVKVHSHTQ